VSADRPAWYRWEDDTLILSVRVQPKASSDEIVGPCVDALGGESLKVRITAPPVDGKANAHLVKFLAKAFGVAKSRVSVVAGDTGRQKRVQINGPTRLPLSIQR
jgi:uncharacterized protein (TIGR00251 family)